MCERERERRGALQIGAATPCASLEHVKAHGFPADKVLGAGIIDGRNVWADTGKAPVMLQAIQAATKANIRVQARFAHLLCAWCCTACCYSPGLLGHCHLWVCDGVLLANSYCETGASCCPARGQPLCCQHGLLPFHNVDARLRLQSGCSLQHVPIDTAMESKLSPQLVAKLAFAVQKLAEIKAVATGKAPAGKGAVAENKEPTIDPKLFSRPEPYAQRRAKQFQATPNVRRPASWLLARCQCCLHSVPGNRAVVEPCAVYTRRPGCWERCLCWPTESGTSSTPRQPPCVQRRPRSANASHLHQDLSIAPLPLSPCLELPLSPPPRLELPLSPPPCMQLPAFPTTTIGSFPQTAEIRKARAELKSGRASPEEHERKMDCFISEVIGIQEGLGLDVLVHGEPERSDMCAALPHVCCVGCLSPASLVRELHTNNHACPVSSGMRTGLSRGVLAVFSVPCATISPDRAPPGGDA